MSKYVNEAFLRERLAKELTKGKTQEAIALDAGVSRQYVSMSLAGRCSFPAALAEALGYTKVKESLFERKQ